MQYIPEFLRKSNYSQGKLQAYVIEGLRQQDCLEVIACATLELQAHMRPLAKADGKRVRAAKELPACTIRAEKATKKREKKSA